MEAMPLGFEVMHTVDAIYDTHDTQGCDGSEMAIQGVWYNNFGIWSVKYMKVDQQHQQASKD